MTQGQLDAAIAELREAIRLKKDHAPAHFDLGTAHARSGQWDQAAAAFARVLELAPDHHFPWYQGAALRLYTGDVEGYRRACREMLERFGKADQPDVVERVARTCLLLPDAVADPERVQRLADRVVTGTEKYPNYRYFPLTKAPADCRAGRCAEAAAGLERFRPKAEGCSSDATAFAILALAEHGLSHAAEAHAALASARALIKKRAPAPGRPFNSRDNWYDWLHAQILYREAEALSQRPEKDRPGQKQGSATPAGPGR